MHNSNTNAFESLSVPKALSKFILPAVISQLATLILNLTDAFFVGRTGDEFQIGAMTITLPLIMLMTVIATVFGAGGNANIASSLGARNPERAKKFSTFAVYTSVIIVAVVSLFIYAFEDILLGVLGATVDSLVHCRRYICWTLHVACVPMVFSQVMAQMFLMNCVDFVRNYLIGIYGAQSDFAAWGVVQKLGNAFLQIALGIAQGVRPLISYNYTAGLGKRTKSLIVGSAIVMGCYTGFCFVFTMLFPEPMVNMFLSIPELMSTAVGFLQIYIFCIFAIGFLELFSAIFQSFGAWKTAIAGAFVGKIFIMMPALLILSRIWAVNGIIAAQPVGDTMAVVFYLIMFVRFVKKNKERFN